MSRLPDQLPVRTACQAVQHVATNESIQMKNIVLCIAIAAVTAACGQQESPIQQSPTPSAASQPAEKSAEQVPAPGKPIPAPTDEQGVDAMSAAGVEFDFPHQVLYDILDVSDNGTLRHRVLVEIRIGEFKQVAGQFTRSLEALGYRKKSSKGNGGRIDSVFVADGKPTYYLLMQPAGMGPKLRQPDSTGSIHIMWNVAKRH